MRYVVIPAALVIVVGLFAPAVARDTGLEMHAASAFADGTTLDPADAAGRVAASDGPTLYRVSLETGSGTALAGSVERLDADLDELDPTRPLDDGVYWFVELEAQPRIGADVTLANGRRDPGDVERASQGGERAVRHGHRAPGGHGGCVYRGEVRIAGLDNPAVEFLDLDEDPQRCLLLVEYRTMDHEDVRRGARGPGYHTDRLEHDLHDPSQRPEGVGAMTHGYYAYTVSEVLDPAFIVVNWVETFTEVYFNNPCGPGAVAGRELGWFLATNWWKQVDVFDSSFSSCVATQAKEHAEFRNNTFCSSAPVVRAHHWPTLVEGHLNNLSNHTHNTTTSGGWCHNLLWSRHAIGLYPV